MNDHRMKAPRGAVRRAFTLVELLVVIVIIGILAALLLPAIQNAREAGRDIKCRSHVKTLAQACLAHDEAHGSLPDGGEHFWYARTFDSSGEPEIAPKQNWGWAYQVLPYCERYQVWKLKDDAKVAASVIEFHYCPSRRAPRLVINQANGPAWSHGPRGMLDYAGNAGTDCPSIGGWGIRGDGKTGAIARRYIPGEDRSRAVKLASLTTGDGTSTTLLIGEKLMNAALVGTQDLGDDDGGFADGWDFDNVRWGCYPPGPDINDGGMEVHRGLYAAQRGAFGSSHPGGFNGAMCDGAVRRFSFSIDFNTFKNLSNREDGNVVQLD